MAITTKKSKKKELEFKSSKEEKLFQNLLKVTEQYMTGKSFTPSTEHELICRLKLPEQHIPLFRKIMTHLVKSGMCEIVSGRFAWKKSKQDVIIGTLKSHPRGFGFVQPENPVLFPEDIFIPKHLTNNAVDGDTVEVLISGEPLSDKGPEGRIITILSRSRTHLAGIVKKVTASEEIFAYVPLLGVQQEVEVEPAKDRRLAVGDRIVMEVTEWGTKEAKAQCKMSHYIGHISDPSCDIKGSIEEFELKSDFPSQVLQEAEEFGKKVSLKDIKNREDLRNLTTVTIDPDTAKDFDDAVSLTKDKNGHYHLGVHIADVSHYVKPGSRLDSEASLRCNSTYFPGFCLPMLPSVLSDNLCSLKENVNRLTVSVLAEFNQTGEMITYRIARTVIKSAKRLTYREAKQILDSKKTSKHFPLLSLMVELCHLFKKKRYERGSIEFAMPELVVIVDKDGVPTHTDYIEYDITHQMVEEFMLKANELVAIHLNSLGKNLSYRIHDIPTEENMRDFTLLAAAFGFRIPEKPTPADFQKFFEEALETPYGRYLATSYIRRMKQAIYSPENVGHYGLSLTHYCHFTSPIRRYVDIVVHRLLFGEDDNLEYLERISEACSEQERISAKAENSVVLLKKLRLLQSIQNSDPYKEYEAVITRVKNFGIYFEIIDFMLEGFLHVSELDKDFFVFEDASLLLRGVRTGYTYSSGNRITVMLKNIDLILLETQWYLVGDPALQQQAVKSPKKNKTEKKITEKVQFKSSKPKISTKKQKYGFKKSSTRNKRK